jgi:hypothetical protein
VQLCDTKIEKTADGTTDTLGGPRFDAGDALKTLLARSVEMDIQKVRSGKVEEEFN